MSNDEVAAENRSKVLRAVIQLADEHGAGDQFAITRLTGLSYGTVVAHVAKLNGDRLIKRATAKTRGPGGARSRRVMWAPTVAGREALVADDEPGDVS